MSITKTIATIPEAPTRTDPSNFDDRADEFLTRIESLDDDLNDWADQCNDTADEINTNATSAASDAATASAARQAAVGAANYVGDWSSSTSYTTGQCVSYNGRRWVAKQNNTNQTPSSGSSYWLLISPQNNFYPVEFSQIRDYPTTFDNDDYYVRRMDVKAFPEDASGRYIEFEVQLDERDCDLALQLGFAAVVPFDSEVDVNSSAEYAMDVALGTDGYVYVLCDDLRVAKLDFDGSISYSTALSPSATLHDGSSQYYKRGAFFIDASGYFHVLLAYTNSGTTNYYVEYFRSIDSGSTWSKTTIASGTTTGYAVGSPGIGQASDGTLIMVYHDKSASNYKVNTSSNNGQTWGTWANLTACNYSGSIDAGYTAFFAVNDDDEIRMLLSYEISGGNGYYEQLKSTDNGSTWTSVSYAATSYWAHSFFAIDSDFYFQLPNLNRYHAATDGEKPYLLYEISPGPHHAYAMYDGNATTSGDTWNITDFTDETLFASMDCFDEYPKLVFNNKVATTVFTYNDSGNVLGATRKLTSTTETQTVKLKLSYSVLEDGDTKSEDYNSSVTQEFTLGIDELKVGVQKLSSLKISSGDAATLCCKLERIDGDDTFEGDFLINSIALAEV